MDKQQAIEQLKSFKETSLISRDKCIEIYNYFKANKNVALYSVVIRGNKLNVWHEEFWSVINITDIRNVYKKINTPTVSVNINDDNNEEEILAPEEYTKLRKETLKYKQKLNFEKKAFDKKLANINTLEELNKEVINSIKKIPEINTREYELPFNKNATGVITLSDLHFNELINTPSNKYDFEVASKRLKKVAIRAKQYFVDNGITNVVLMMLGDNLNSDRRMAEVFNMATNRSHALVLAFHLLRQFIADMVNVCDITVASVSGNESRVVGEEYDMSNIMATYNYDYTLHQFLKVAFENNSHVKFIDGDYGEKVLNINNSNVLMTHGTGLKVDLEKSVQQTIGRYSSNGVNIDYVFCGHLHSCRIGDTCARCGSLCGGNSYSEGALNLNSRASQLIGTFYSDKTNEILRVDVQNVDNIQGYDIIDKLEEYNTKSASKKHKFLIHNI